MLGDGIEFRALGPIEVAVHGRNVALSPQLKLVLSVLLVEADRVVSNDQLIQILWGDDTPPDAHTRVAKLIYRLRAVLSPDAANHVETRSPGYMIHVDGVYDANNFEQLARAAHRLVDDRRTTEALSLLDQALELWRGPAFAETANEEFARTEVVRLEELRTDALEDRIRAKLDLGRHHELIGELKTLIETHPFRESLWGLLMLALYRSGRQADALSAYRTMRTKLGDELGIEPSHQLQELETAILRQEPTLAWHDPDQPAPPPDTSTAPLPEPPNQDAHKSGRNDPSPSPSITARQHRTRRDLVQIGLPVATAIALLVLAAFVLNTTDETKTTRPRTITVPYQGTLVETLEGNSQGSTSSGTITGGLIGNGTYTSISRTNQIPPHCTVGQGVPTSTSTVLKSRTGDTLLQEETGTLCASGPTSFEFTGTFTFAGGSGCFANATGHGDITAQITFDDQRFTTGRSTSHDVGSITVPNKPNCPQAR
jgi:DNA-binding SARP family transcriptional activator